MTTLTAARSTATTAPPGKRPRCTRAAAVKLATFNINGIGARLPQLLRWLSESRPDVVCLQELKTVDAAFPAAALQEAGYGALWVGQKAWNGVAVLARDATPQLVRNALPGDAADAQARYLEAAVQGVLVACLYLPNGNPQPGPKFDYKLAWFERLIAHAQTLATSRHPVVLAGDFNVVPTDFDIYKPDSWRKDALLQPESRDAFARLLAQGWTDALRALHPEARIYTFWDYFRQHWQRDAGLRIDHLLLNKVLARRLQDAGVDRDVRGWERASDHAPAWVMLGDSTKTTTSKAKASAKTSAKASPKLTAKPTAKAKTPARKTTAAPAAMRARRAG
jgi:exodeoxyribonuclease III